MNDVFYVVPHFVFRLDSAQMQSHVYVCIYLLLPAQQYDILCTCVPSVYIYILRIYTLSFVLLLCSQQHLTDLGSATFCLLSDLSWSDPYLLTLSCDHGQTILINGVCDNRNNNSDYRRSSSSKITCMYDVRPRYKFKYYYCNISCIVQRASLVVPTARGA